MMRTYSHRSQFRLKVYYRFGWVHALLAFFWPLSVMIARFVHFLHHHLRTFIARCFSVHSFDDAFLINLLCSTRVGRNQIFCQRPYCVECTGSHLNSEVKPRKARIVLGWVTAREVLRVLLTFFKPLRF